MHGIIIRETNWEALRVEVAEVNTAALKAFPLES
jgi:hypothetical protein